MTSIVDMRRGPVRKTVGDFILVVEHDQDIRELLILCIEKMSTYYVLSYVSAKEALQDLEPLKEAHPVLFMFDLWLPEMTGISLYDHFHTLAAFERVPAIILMTPISDQTIEVAAAERGLKILLQPFDLDDLIQHIEQALA